MYVVDASVLAKTVKREHDSDTAVEWLAHCVEKPIGIVAPTLLVYELVGLAVHTGIPAARFFERIEDARAGGLVLLEPSREDWLLAETIALGHPDHGRPGLADSVYHAIAIRRGATMITADRSHFNKTKHRGHVTMLADWREG